MKSAWYPSFRTAPKFPQPEFPQPKGRYSCPDGTDRATKSPVILVLWLEVPPGAADRCIEKSCSSVHPVRSGWTLLEDLRGESAMAVLEGSLQVMDREPFEG